MDFVLIWFYMVETKYGGSPFDKEINLTAKTVDEDPAGCQLKY